MISKEVELSEEEKTRLIEKQHELAIRELAKYTNSFDCKVFTRVT